MTTGRPRPSAADEALRERLRVLLLARVLIVTVFLAGAGSLILATPGRGWAILGNLTFGAIVLAYAGTIISALVVRSVGMPRQLAYLQIIFDVLLLTAGLAVLRGVGGPSPLLYVLPIANAAALLTMHGAVVAALVSSAAYVALLQHVQGSAALGVGLGPILLALAGVAVPFVLIAVAIGTIARRLARTEEELVARKIEMDQLENVHRTLANELECGVLLVDRAGRVRSANPVSQEIFGLPLSGILGRELDWLVPLLASATESSPGAEFVACERRMADGSSRRLRVRRTPLADTYANAIGDLVVLQDMTRIEELEARLASEDEPQLEVDRPGDEEEAAPSASPGGPGAEDGLIGDCTSMSAVVRLIDKVATADATVLITGESGTGKELVARAIHRRSPRVDGPFVVVNCGAIPETLIESELFGHVRGAYTGAIADRPGLFRRAHGGTIFLDEIGELSPALQVRLLRVLQDHTVLPVGGSKSIEVDVRVLAATNRVLENLVRDGGYREDLYYRLAVISIEVPPLRQRGNDLELLIAHFVRQAATRHAKTVRGVSAKAMRRLLQHTYPGNVRELENVIEHAITLADGEVVRERDLPESVRGPMPEHLPMESEPPHRPLVTGVTPLPDDERIFSEPELVAESPAVLLPVDEGEGASLDEQLARREKEMLLAALERAAGVKKRAAELLGINYRSFRHRLQKYGLDGHGEALIGRSVGSWPRETGH